MTLFRSATLAAILSLFLPSFAFAHHDVAHEGCPAGQSFVAGAITVTGAYTRATLPGAQSAGGYLVISNSGTAPDTLTGVSTEAAQMAAIHLMQMQGDVMQMAPVEGGIVVPAKGSVALAPRGYHLMLMGLDQPFEAGECVRLTLHFEREGDLDIELSVGTVGQDGPPESEHAMMEMPSMETRN